MADLAYTAEGTFDQNGQASINVCIPAETIVGEYYTAVYNLSKKTSVGVINVIFCHFSNHSQEPLNHDGFDYLLNLDLKKLENGQQAVSFDENNPDALFIFFHNDVFNSSDRDLYFNQIEDIYNEVKIYGSKSLAGIDNPTLNATDCNPRRIGMSLIIKPRR